MKAVSRELVKIPIIQFLPRDILNGHYSNVMSPNLTALRAMVEEALFKVLQAFPHPKIDRGYLKAQAVNDTVLEHWRKRDSADDVSTVS